MRNALADARRFARGDFVRHGLLVFISTTAVNAFGFAFHFLISRKVGVEQYGILSALNSFLMIAALLATISGTIVVKYAAEFRAVGDRARIAALVRRVIRYAAIAIGIAAAVGVASVRALAAYLQIGSVMAVGIALAIAAFGIALPALRAIFQGTENFRDFSISICLESGLKLVLGVGCVEAGYGVVGALAGWAVGTIVALIVTATMLLARYRDVGDGSLFIDFRRLAQTTAGVGSATALLTSISYVDTLIVKHFADPTTAGLYGALSQSGRILLFVVGFVPTVLLPKATRQALEGTSPLPILFGALATVVAMSGTLLVVYDLYPKLVVTALAGPAFGAAAPYVFPYGIAMVLLAALNVVTMYKIGLHRFDFIVPLAICALGEVVGLSLRHASIGDVIAVLIVGNGFAFVACAYNLAVIAPARTPGATRDAAVA